MSGYGVDVSQLMRSAGWELKRITRDTSPVEAPFGKVVGLVLVE
jgi:hypothetical protein